MIELLIAFHLHQLEAKRGWWIAFGVFLVIKYAQFGAVMIDVARHMGI